MSDDPAYHRFATRAAHPIEVLRVDRAGWVTRCAVGFTLIELLLVIGIIGILIAMLMPALAAAKRQASSVSCLSDIRQVAGGMYAFAADHDDRLPSNRVNVAPGEHITWRQLFVDQDYLPQGKLWVCPLTPTDPLSELGGSDAGSQCVGDVPSSYAVNGHLAWLSQHEPYESERDMATIARPSHTILLTETRTTFPDLRVLTGLIAYQDEYGGHFGFWHPNFTGAYAFGDGHTESARLLDTGNPDCRWHNGWDNEVDAGTPQTEEESTRHGHDDWWFDVASVYKF